MTAGNPHGLIDAENLARDRRLAALIRSRPQAIKLARLRIASEATDVRF